MPIICEELPIETVAGIQRRLERVDPSHPLVAQVTNGDVHVWREKDTAIFRYKENFYFQPIQHDLETTILRDIAGRRNCLCMALLIPDTLGIEEQIKDEFVVSHGFPRWKDLIETVRISFEGKTLLLMKVPSLFVRNMMAPMGGSLRSFFTGPAPVLAQLPVLQEFQCVPKNIDTQYGSGFVTAYGKGQYMEALRIHWRLVQDVISKPNSGITLRSVGVWNP